MINYENFNMIINKDFMRYNEFYDRIIEHWLYTEKQTNITRKSVYALHDKILIYSDKVDITESEILRMVKCNYKCLDIKISHLHEITQIQLSCIDNKKTLIVIIQPLNNLKLDQRGLRLVGIIIDIDDKDKTIINKYLDDDFIINKLYCYLTIPTNLNIGLVLYH